MGTIFGGSMYAAVDPIYMMMLIQVLGPEYVVWDKAASIRFIKPGTGSLFARFVVGQDEIDAIRSSLEERLSVDRQYRIELRDKTGLVRASVEKIVYVRKAAPAAMSKAA
jgi:hypothetical protein